MQTFLTCFLIKILSVNQKVYAHIQLNKSRTIFVIKKIINDN
jgi:hypothetical protein